MPCNLFWDTDVYRFDYVPRTLAKLSFFADLKHIFCWFPLMGWHLTHAKVSSANLAFFKDRDYQCVGYDALIVRAVPFSFQIATELILAGADFQIEGQGKWTGERWANELHDDRAIALFADIRDQQRAMTNESLLTKIL